MRSETSGRNGLLLSFFYLLLSVVPCATVFGRHTWPLLAIWASAGGVRFWRGDRAVLQDCILFGAINALLLRRELLASIGKRWGELERLKVETLSLSTFAIRAVIPLAIFGFALCRRYGRNDHGSVSPARSPPDVRVCSTEYPKPLLFPCRTSHARMFPQKHAFGYTYLLCGFPISPTCTAADGNEVRDGEDQIMGSWWLRIRAEDYLERGYGALGFYGKLKLFLRGQVCQRL